MIRIVTIADHLREGFEVIAHCHACGRQNASVDLQALVAAGRGNESMIRRRWRCTRCGGAGGITIMSPRVPTHEQCTGRTG